MLNYSSGHTSANTHSDQYMKRITDSNLYHNLARALHYFTFTWLDLAYVVQ